MASLIGQVEPFQVGVEDWDQYTERLEQYFIANGIDAEAKKVAVLLTMVGAKAYSLMSNLVAPAKPSTKAYDELVAAMKAHLKPKPLTIAERFKFHNRNQREGESVPEYVAELRRLADRCQFEGHLDQALRDRLVCGLRQEAIQRKLLTMAGLTMAKAYETAQGMEAADMHASELQASTKIKPAEVQFVQQGARRDKKSTAGDKKSTAAPYQGRTPAANRAGTTPCYRCGKNHSAETCYYRGQQCRACNNTGHIAKMSRRTNLVQEDQGEELDEEEELPLFNIQAITPGQRQKAGGHPGIVVDLKIEGKQVMTELDTGASVSIMAETTWKKTFGKLALQPSPIKLKTYTGEGIQVLGQRVVWWTPT